jgi:hypothetical protein
MSTDTTFQSRIRVFPALSLLYALVSSSWERCSRALVCSLVVAIIGRSDFILWDTISICGIEPQFDACNNGPDVRSLKAPMHFHSFVHFTSLFVCPVEFRYLIPSLLSLRLHHRLESNMANPENEKTTLQTATRRNNDEAPPPAPTPTKPLNNDDEPFHPFTIYVTKIITDAAELQPTPAPTPDQPQGTPPPRSPNSTTLAPKPIVTHITRVGTVVSPTDVPDKWAPKYLQGEQSAQIKLLIGLTMMFVAVGLFVIGSSLWR